MDTTNQFERDADSRRAKMDSTLDQLKDRMSVDRLVDDATRFLGLDQAGATLRRIGGTMQANPVALGLMGVGLACLIVGFGSSRGSAPRRAGQDDDTWTSGLSGAAGDAAGRVRDAVGTVQSEAADLASAARDKVESGLGRVSETAGHLREDLSARLEDNPLLIGGLAVLLGTVVGISLPRTQTENSLMGRQRDQLLDDAKAASVALRDRAVDAAQKTYDAAVNTARGEGLLPSEDHSLASRVGAVAEAALDEAKRQVEPVLQMNRHVEGE